MTQIPTRDRTLGTVLFFIVVAMVLYSFSTDALPSSPTITFNSTGASPDVTPPNRTDSGGTITWISFDANQQNPNWKAYVGNVTGKYTLDDVNGNTIYDWTIIGTISGEVYASRNETITWSTINCSNTTVISGEESALSMAGGDSDSINMTFNETFHDSFLVGTVNITTNTCRSTPTYLNDTKQSLNGNTSFIEVLLADDSRRLVYSAILEQNLLGFDNSSVFDFQIILAEDGENPTPSTYYFWAEI